ncbi:MAG: response regulator [Veillonellales bacterium]
MGLIKVMIVDDSPFSRTLLAETLQENGCEVVGEAESLETMLETYPNCKPDIVTMDIAMPGADGFECSKALLLHDPAAKIVLVSSMKDEETETEAKRIGIVGYIQKPVDADVLRRILTNVLAPDSLFESLTTFGIAAFKEALAQNVTRMTKATASFVDESPQETRFTSQGIAVVIGIIGRYSGSMILDLSVDTAKKMAQVILRREAKNLDEVLALGAEFANIVAGVACSMLNKKEKALGLRVAPPNVFYGAPTEVVSPTLQIQSIHGATNFGPIYLGIGFQKESVLWM